MAAARRPEGTALLVPRRRWGLVIAAALAIIGGSLVFAAHGNGGQPPAPAIRIPAPEHPGETPSAPATTRDTPTHPREPRHTRGSSPAMDRAIPVALTIPSIQVHSPLLELGLQPDGTVEVPPYSKSDMAGWYRHSPTPGEIGPSVIIGHLDSRSHGPGVFYRLGALREGDEIRVRRADGTVAVFTVTRSAAYPKTAFPTRAVYGDIDHAGLRLITCGGQYTPAGGYQANIVVFASLTDTRHLPPGRSVPAAASGRKPS